MVQRDRRVGGRRRVLAAVGTALGVGLAGCAGDDDDTEEDAEPENDDTAGTSEFLVDHPVDEPTEFDDSHMCAVCSMGVTNYADRMAQLAHEDGDGVMFCSPGCLFAYAVEPVHFGGSDAEVAGAWVVTFDTGELVDADEAAFVIDSDETRADAPMQLDPHVYEVEEDALAFVEEHDDLEESDVIEFSDVDGDVARLYRLERLP